MMEVGEVVYGPNAITPSRPIAISESGPQQHRLTTGKMDDQLQAPRFPFAEALR
jgi:hypothetical protein